MFLFTSAVARVLKNCRPHGCLHFSIHLALDGGPPPLLFYASRMFTFSLQFVILLPVLLFLALPAGSEVHAKARSILAPEPEVAIPVEEDASPCEELQVTSDGVLCKSKYGLMARLDFPEVDLKSALSGGEYLPQARAVFTADEKTVGDKDYRNIAFVLRWEPATPEFLQIYLNEYVPYWGNRVPYRLFWNTRYEVCSLENCTGWVVVSGQGEFLPSDVANLQGDLAADINFNGVPAAFWNTKISQ